MNQEKIGKFIAECRKQKKMTQEELAVKLGVNNRSVSRWENGKCLPDISLYNDLCKELGITINEFLSGEKVSDEKYQERFEKNIIEVVKQTDDKYKFYNRLGCGILLFIAFIILYLLTMSFISNFKFEQKYDKNDFSITIRNKIIEFNHYKSGDIKYLITKNNNDVLIFITFYQTIAEKLESKNYYFDITGYDLTKEMVYQREISFNDNKMPENFKVYYTNINFSKIANSKKLDSIINKSHLLYDSNKK